MSLTFYILYNNIILVICKLNQQRDGNYILIIRKLLNHLDYMWICIFSDRTVTSNIDTNVTVTWRTNCTNVFSIVNPRNNLIYSVDPGGNIINNGFSTKYIYNKASDTVQEIYFTVIKAEETDAGIYKLKTNGGNTPFGDCSLLIITGNGSGI